VEGQVSLLHAIILGVVQGASEFLPISSSGHLVIFQQLLGVNLEEGPMVAFDVCLHVGTLIAVVAALWQEIWSIKRRTIWLIIIGTIPAVIVGFTFKDFFESLFSSQLPVGIALIVTGLILFATRWVRRNDVDAGKMRWWHALIVGCAQALAIFPGISRSGSTISAGLFSRLDRTFAAKFSFLLSIPAIGGAAILQSDNLRYLSINNILPTVVGTLISAVVGYACVRWIIAIMRGRNFSAFAYYCWFVGLVTILGSSLF
jgi:undecaprenyl-diphosphatase